MKTETYGESAKRRRLALRLPLQAVAHKAGCGMARYARIESGAVEPTTAERESIERLLGRDGSAE